MTTRKKASLVRRILRLNEKTKALYKLRDSFTDQLIAAVPAGEIILADGREFTIVDNFAEKNQVWSGACVRRFELDEKKPLPARPRKPVGSEVAA